MNGYTLTQLTQQQYSNLKSGDRVFSVDGYPMLFNHTDGERYFCHTTDTASYHRLPDTAQPFKTLFRKPGLFERLLAR